MVKKDKNSMLITNNEELNNGNIWVTNFYLLSIQMPGESSGHGLNSELKVHNST